MTRDASPLASLFRSGSIYTVGGTVQLAGGILVLPVLTRILPPAEYGIVATAIVAQTLLALVAALGLPFALVRTFFRDADGHSASRSLVALTVLLAALVTVVADLTGPYWSKVFADVPYEGALRWATLTVLPIAGMTATQSLLRAQERPTAFAATIGLATAGHGIGVGIAALGGGPSGYVIGLAVGFVAAFALGLTLSGAARRPVRLPSRAVGRTALRVGLPIVPHSLAIYVMNAGDRVVVERLEGLAAVGRYQLAYVVGSVAFVLVGALNNAWAPIVFKQSEERRWAVLAETSRAVIWLAALLAGALALGAPLALAILAPPAYDLEALAPVSAIVAGSVVLVTIYFTHAHPIFWHGQTMVFAIVTPLAAAANIGLNFALIPPLGLDGAALATLAAYALQALAVTVVTRSTVEVPWPDRTFVLACATGLGLAAIAVLQPATGIWIAVRAAEAGALLAGVGMLWLRSIRVDLAQDRTEVAEPEPVVGG